MVSSGKLPPQLALQVLNHFDASMTQALSDNQTGQANIKGHLHTYRGCDGVWTFFVEEANFKVSNTVSILFTQRLLGTQVRKPCSE